MVSKRLVQVAKSISILALGKMEHLRFVQIDQETWFNYSHILLWIYVCNSWTFVLNLKKDLPSKWNACLDMMALRLSFILLRAQKMDLFFLQRKIQRKDVRKLIVTRKKFYMFHQKHKLWHWSRFQQNVHKKSSIRVISLCSRGSAPG